jgi:NADH-quinone oxidoreductase subunit M
LIQPNIKRLIAYSSISHLGFVVLGIFTFTQQGTDGAVYQMIAHGLSTGALFLLVGFLEARRNSLEIDDFGGWAATAPRLAVGFMVTLLASIGLPSLCNFIGEFLILQGAAITKFSWAVWASGGVILSAAYMLWMYGRVFFGRLRQSTIAPDLRVGEWAPVLLLMFFMVWLGTYTQSFLPPITSATARLLDQVNLGNQYRVATPAISPVAGIEEAGRAR